MVSIIQFKVTIFVKTEPLYVAPVLRPILRPKEGKSQRQNPRSISRGGTLYDDTYDMFIDR